MNPKIEKLDKEILKISTKIADLQKKLGELENEKTVLENEDYVTIARSYSLTPAQLADFLKNGQLPKMKEESHES